MKTIKVEIGYRLVLVFMVSSSKAIGLTRDCIAERVVGGIFRSFEYSLCVERARVNLKNFPLLHVLTRRKIGCPHSLKVIPNARKKKTERARRTTLR